MASRRFARPLPGSLAVTRIKSISIAISVIAVAAGLAGCASAPPFSVEERLFFDKATGSGIIGPPGLRMRDLGYAPPVGRVYRLGPPEPEAEEQ
jgi:hypothetical protein